MESEMPFSMQSLKLVISWSKRCVFERYQDLVHLWCSLKNMESELNALSKQFKNSRRLPNLIHRFKTVHNETGYNETIAFICGFYIPSLIQRIFNIIEFRLNKTTAIFANQMHKNFIWDHDLSHLTFHIL